jgi:hypothetical protein
LKELLKSTAKGLIVDSDDEDEEEGGAMMAGAKVRISWFVIYCLIGIILFNVV